MRKVNPTLVGAFVLGAIGLVMAIVILFGGGKLFQKTVPVVMYFEGSVKGLQQKSLQEFFTRNYRPNRTIIAVVGDVTEQEIAQALNIAMKNWTKGTPAGKPSAPEIGKTQNVEINNCLLYTSDAADEL